MFIGAYTQAHNCDANLAMTSPCDTRENAVNAIWQDILKRKWVGLLEMCDLYEEMKSKEAAPAASAASTEIKKYQKTMKKRDQPLVDIVPLMMPCELYERICDDEDDAEEEHEKWITHMASIRITEPQLKRFLEKFNDSQYLTYIIQEI